MQGKKLFIYTYLRHLGMVTEKSCNLSLKNSVVPVIKLRLKSSIVSIFFMALVIKWSFGSFYFFFFHCVSGLYLIKQITNCSFKETVKVWKQFFYCCLEWSHHLPLNSFAPRTTNLLKNIIKIPWNTIVKGSFSVNCQVARNW